MTLVGRETVKSLEERIKESPADLQQEVADSVDFLLEKRARKRGRTPRQDWAGALSDYRDQHISLELQKKAMEWQGH